jgi:ribosome-associated translation inhibitor RaiA
MQFSNQSRNLRIELDTKDFEFSPQELERVEQAVDPLRDPVRDFPVSDLYITVTHHPAPDDYHVRASLVLPGRTLFTGDRDENALSAWNRCVRKLVRKLSAYKENLAAKPERAKAEEGTAHDVVPAAELDADLVRRAVESGDYAAFREATFVYEEAVRKRAGRWIERYPEFTAQLGVEFTLSDVVEEVFLNAFEHFHRRPQNLRPGEWLENLIDPSVRALLEHPDDERENIEAVRTLRETSTEEE